MLAFRIGTAGFVACGTVATGRFGTLAARLTLGARAFTGSIAARCAFGTRAITGLLAIARSVGFTARLAVTRTIGVAGLLAIARTVGFAAGLAVTGAFGFGPALAVARREGAFTDIAVARSARRRSETAGAVAITRSAGRRAEISAGSAFAQSFWRRARGAVAATPHAWERRRPHQLFDGELAVVVPVELAQGFGSVLDFLLGDDPVAVPVERGDDGWHRRPFAATGFAGRTVELRAAFAGRRSRRTALRRLCERETCRQGER